MQFVSRYMTRAVILLCLVLSTLEFGCSPSNPKNTKSILRLNINQDQLTLDPRKGADFSSVSVQFLLFEGLVQMTPYASRVPGLAERVEVSDDLKKYTFHLREAYWSDGSPITAHDFVQTWRDILRPNFDAPNAHLFYCIKNAEKYKCGEVKSRDVGIRALDHKTIVIFLEYPTPYLLDMFSFAVFHPVNQSKAVLNPKWSDGAPDELLCNGPFRLKERQRGYKIVLEKNPFYWDKNSVQLDEIHISLGNSEQTALKLYEQGELDFLGLPFTGIISDSVPELMDKGLIKTTPLPASTICCFNMHSDPFSNVNIRKAFAYAINRDEIIKNITRLGEGNGVNLLPKSIGLDTQPFFEDGDVERAREYLEKGLTELGISLEELGHVKLLHATSGIYPLIAQALQAQWLQNLGVIVQLEGYEYKVFLNKLTKRDYQMAQCIWIAQYLDPANFFNRFKNLASMKNYPGFYNPEYEEILEKSLTIENREERFKYLRKAEEILVDAMPLTAIYHWKNAYLVQDNIQYLDYNSGGGFYFHHVNVDEKPIFDPHKIDQKTLRGRGITTF